MLTNIVELLNSRKSEILNISNLLEDKLFKNIYSKIIDIPNYILNLGDYKVYFRYYAESIYESVFFSYKISQ